MTPITSGHFSLIEKCASRFDEVHVVAFINAEKKALFSVSQREEMLKIACRPFSNVVTGSDSGYVVELCGPTWHCPTDQRGAGPDRFRI